MRIFVAVSVLLLCCASALAGMTPEEMRARLIEIDKQMRAMDIEAKREFRRNTLESVREDLRDNERRSFELDLEQARANARREAMLIHAKEESERNKVQAVVLQRRLLSVRKQREVAQSELARVSEQIDAGKIPPREATALKLQMIRFDEETATLEYEMSGGETHFSSALTDIEIDLAGIEASRKLLVQRGESLNAIFDRLVAFEEERGDLEGERVILQSELMERSVRVPN